MPTILGAFFMHFGGGGGFVGDFPWFARRLFFLDGLLDSLELGSILGVMCIPTIIVLESLRELLRLAIILLTRPHLRLNFRAMFAQFRGIFFSSKAFMSLVRFAIFKHTV